MITKNFLYIEDKDLILHKEHFKDNPVTIQKIALIGKESNTAYAVYLADKLLYESKDKEDCQYFISRLAESLGSDIL